MQSNKCEYPSLDGTIKNCRLACELKRQYFCELNAVSEYIYQSIMFEEAMPELAAIFEDIAIDEMRHFRMLGELMRLLGRDPVINMALRTSGGLMMCTDVESRAPVAAVRELERNIADEKAAYKEYLRLGSLAEQLGELPAAALLRRLSEDEQAHLLRQEALLRKLI